LIDEYDKPLLETMEDPGLNGEIREELKGFYGILKAADPWLRFVFLTGVTKFSQVSVFSSVLNTLDGRSFNYYWFQTGTPTFLTDLLTKANFDLPRLSEGALIPRMSITDHQARGGSLLPILYQSGCLTIKNYDEETRLYTLGFPNEEVEYGFLSALLPYRAGEKKLVKVGVVFDPVKRTIGEWKAVEG
jgi:hypothetical protein